MGETGIIVRYSGTLDPRAKEFRPTTITVNNNNNQPIQWYPLTIPLPVPPTSVAYATTPPPPHFSTTPTRSLLLTPLPITSTESSLRTQLQSFGDIRALHLQHGILTVHFFDLRHAQSAFTAIRSMHNTQQKFFQFSPVGLPVSAHYILPQAHNQGTLVIFNLDPHVTTHTLRQLFQPFGPIKELRDTPWKKNQRFIEFFDARDAAEALKHMNGKEIHGKQLVIEFSRPGGQTRKFFNSNPNSNNNTKTTTSFDFNVQQQRCRLAAPRLKSSSSPDKGSGSVEATIGSLSLSQEISDEVEEEQVHLGSLHRRNLSRKQNCETILGNTKQQQVLKSRNWKGKQPKKHETRFLIKEDAILESAPRDTRTTVMIKNIPNKYSQKLLLNMLDNHCIHCNEQIIADGDEQPLSSYDFVYLPIDFNNKCNVGYGFVNMTSPEATLRLYKAFHLQHWEVFNSRKICEVTYARVQGLEALKEHFKNSKFPCEMEHYLPVVFSPARDGRELTEPLPIVGNKQQAIPIPSCDEKGDDDDVVSSKSGGEEDDDDDTNKEKGVVTYEG